MNAIHRVRVTIEPMVHAFPGYEGRNATLTVLRIETSAGPHEVVSQEIMEWDDLESGFDYYVRRATEETRARLLEIRQRKAA